MVDGLTLKKMFPDWHARENAKLITIPPQFDLISSSFLAGFGRNNILIATETGDIIYKKVYILCLGLNYKKILNIIY